MSIRDSKSEAAFKQRREIFNNTDVDGMVKWFIKYTGFAPSSRKVAEIALHRARYEATDVCDKLRNESREWLVKHDMPRLNQLPWPPEGTLPL